MPLPSGRPAGRLAVRAFAWLLPAWVAVTASPALAQPSADPEAALVARATQLLTLVRDRLPGCAVPRAAAPRALPVAWTPTEPSPEPSSVAGPAPLRPALRWQPRLAAAAEGHTRAMARLDFFDHVDPSGRTVAHRVQATGYAWRVVGETLAAGQASLEEALRDWLASPSHCAALLDARFTEFGLARVAQPQPGAPDAALWTLVLGRPAGAR